MRTNIDLDDKLLAKAKKILGTSTKKATVEKALRQIIEDYRGRQAIANLRGIGWVGDLEEMRRDRNFDQIK